MFRSIGYRGVPLPGRPVRRASAARSPTTAAAWSTRLELGAIPGLYAVGWIKRGPSGVIGTNKRDAQETVDLLIEDLHEGRLPAPVVEVDSGTPVEQLLEERGVEVRDLRRLGGDRPRRAGRRRAPGPPAREAVQLRGAAGRGAGRGGGPGVGAASEARRADLGVGAPTTIVNSDRVADFRRGSARRPGAATPAGDRRGRRRAGGAGRGLARSEARVRRAIPGDARRLGRRGTRSAQAGARAWRAGRVAGRRPADAGPVRNGLPRAGARAGSRGQARSADGLCRHRGGDPGHQRGLARLLPAEALGPAR